MYPTSNFRVNDRIISANGVSLEHADFATAVSLMKEAQQLNMVRLLYIQAW